MTTKPTAPKWEEEADRLYELLVGQYPPEQQSDIVHELLWEQEDND